MESAVLVMELSEYLKKPNILLKSSSTNRWDLIEEMVDLAVRNKMVDPADSDEVKRALIEREKSMSTGIGNGVAIPHCTTSRVSDTVMVLAVLGRGMDFDSIDDQPVNIVVLLLVPKNKLTQHVKTLAKIAKVMSNQGLRDSIGKLKSADGIIDAIRDVEQARR